MARLKGTMPGVSQTGLRDEALNADTHDASGRIEYVRGGPNADLYASYIANTRPEETLTPTLVVFEVYWKVKKDRGEEKALEARVTSKT